MNKLLKVLGAAALIAGVTPYRYNKDEETGEQKIQALLWKAVRTPQMGEKDKTVVNIGFISPFEKKGEKEIFAEGVTVEYGGGLEEEEPVMVVNPITVEEPEEAAPEAGEPEAPEKAETAEEAEQPEESAEA